jgi:Leucine-rich repeat (LRR) protein
MGFKGLKNLKLDNNMVKILPKCLFSDLKLQAFSIQNNLLVEIPEDII